MALAVKGLAQLTRTFKHAGADINREYRKELGGVGEIVRIPAESLALSSIRRMVDSPQWAKMRTGVTTRRVYVAPRQKGARGRGRRRRPNLAPLLMGRALEPALEHNRSRVEAEFGQMLDRLVARWGHDGP